jgi:hypothetical protein
MWYDTAIMALQLDDVSTLQQYLAGVVRRADHHGDNVKFVVFPLIGAIVLFKNPDSEIKVLTHVGTTGNVLWVHIGASKYAFSYQHSSESIVMKRGGIQGPILAQFTNAMSVPEIVNVFESL